jgi:hypothetical protein
VIALTLLDRVVEEFGMYQPRSQGRGLTMRQHEQCRTDFGNFCLLPLFQMVVSTLDGLLNQGLTPECQLFCATAIRVVHSMVSWRFAQRLSGQEEDAPDVLPVPGVWKFLLLNMAPSADGVTPANPIQPILHRNIPAIFVEYYRLFAANAASAAATGGPNVVAVLASLLGILVQLCSIQPMESTGWSQQEGWLLGRICADQLFDLVKVIMSSYTTGKDGDLLEKCCLGFERICSSLNADGVLFCNVTDTTFFSSLLLLTQALISHSISQGDDEELTESLDHLLSAWTSLLSGGLSNIRMRIKLEGTEVGKAIAQCGSTVFRIYVASKLQESAQANRDPTADSNHAEEYARSHTELVALLGREQPELVAAFLLGHISSQAQAYCTSLAQRVLPTRQLNESLWYLLTIGGHFLADSDEGDRPSIPTAITSLGNQLDSLYPQQFDKQITENPVFSLVNVVMEVSKVISTSFLTQMVSPGVVESILFFFKRYVGAYLFPDRDLQCEIPDSFAYVFSNGVALADAAMKFTSLSLQAFYHDSDVVKACAALLRSFTGKSRDFEQWFIQQPSFAMLRDVARTSRGAVMLEGLHRGSLCSFLINICPMDQIEELVLKVVVPPLTDSLNNPGELNTLIDSIATIQGIVGSIRTNDYLRLVWPYVDPLISLSVVSLQHHPRHKPLLTSVLRLLNTIITEAGFHMEEQHYYQVVQGCMSVVDMVSTTMAIMREELKSAAAAHRSREWLDQEEEEQLAVLVSAAKLVLSIATWSLLDFSDDSVNRGANISILCCKGLMIVMRFSADKVTIPALRDNLFALLKEVALTHTETLLTLPAEDLTLVVQGIRYAIQCGDSHVVQLGFDIVEAIANFSSRTGRPIPVLQEFLTLLVESCATGGLDAQLVPSLANALYSLVAAGGPDAVIQSFGSVFATQHQLLATSYHQFERLLRTTDFSNRRKDGRFRFTSKLESVLSVVRGARLW